MRTYKVPGISVAVFDEFRVVWAKAYGVKEAGNPEPVTLETLFQAGSISKPVAAMSAMYCVERGLFSLDDDINTKLTSWKLPDNEFTRSEKVTLRRLLSHSAGLTVHGFPGYAVTEPVPTVVQVLDGAKPANTLPCAWTRCPAASSSTAAAARPWCSWRSWTSSVSRSAARSSHQAQVLARDIELLAVRPLPVWLFPDHETLPYDPFSPHTDLIAVRLKTLAALGAARHGILLAPASSLMQRLPRADYILQRSFDLAVGQPLVIEAFRQRLHHAGYEAAEQVYQSGQFAIRGSVIDLFPAGSSSPYRLDLFDEEIESIQAVRPGIAGSTGKVERIALLPAREYPCDDQSLEAFRRAFRYRFAVDTRNVNLYQDLRAGVLPQGLEQYLPLFHERTSCRFRS